MLDIFRKNFLLRFRKNFCVVWVVARLQDSSMQEDSEEEKPAGAVPCWDPREPLPALEVALRNQEKGAY